MDFMNTPIEWLAWTGLHMSPWKVIGLTGALMFGGRWIVQFFASRRHRKPVIPRLFWYMSLVGSAMTLAYFLFSAGGRHPEPVSGIHRELQPVAGHQASWLESRSSESLIPLDPARA